MVSLLPVAGETDFRGQSRHRIGSIRETYGRGGGIGGIDRIAWTSECPKQRLLVDRPGIHHQHGAALSNGT